MENPIKMDDLGYPYFRKHPPGWVIILPQFLVTAPTARWSCHPHPYPERSCWIDGNNIPHIADTAARRDSSGNKNATVFLIFPDGSMGSFLEVTVFFSRGLDGRHLFDVIYIKLNIWFFSSFLNLQSFSQNNKSCFSLKAFSNLEVIQKGSCALFVAALIGAQTELAPNLLCQA